MKKNILFFTGSLIALFLLFGKRCVKIPASNGKILVQKITKEKVSIEGDWIEVVIEEDSVRAITELQMEAQALEDERNHYYSRYQHYKEKAGELLKNIQERNVEISKSIDCEEKQRLKDGQISELRKHLARDSTLIAELFQEYDKKGSRREYSGNIEAELYKTQWKATVFGIMPPDGMLIKTDVTSVTTTIEEPYEVWKKNSIGIFGGVNQDLQPVFGFDYERRNKWAGLFGQLDYKPKEKRLGGRTGFRIHF